MSVRVSHPLQVIFMVGNKSDLESQVCSVSLTECLVRFSCMSARKKATSPMHETSLKLNRVHCGIVCPSCILPPPVLLLLQRDVTYEEAKQFADENGLLFLETSAKTLACSCSRMLDC